MDPAQQVHRADPQGRPGRRVTGSTTSPPAHLRALQPGYIIWDEALAQRFLDYWELLADPGVTRGPLLAANVAAEPTPEAGSLPPADRMLTLFSPRDDEETVETLRWYADLMAAAERILCVTFAFNLDDFFNRELLRKDDTLRYALFDKNLKTDVEEQIDQIRNTVIASGAKLGAGDLKNFSAET